MTGYDRIADRTILVTGAGGYVGSVLTPRLLARGWRVRALDVFWFGRAALDGVAAHPACEIIEGDVCDAAVVRRAVAGCDAVINLAAVSNDPCGELDPQLTWEVNCHAVRSLVRAAKSAGVRRLLAASSASVYGIRDEPEVTEDCPCTPLTVYSRSKLEAEAAIVDACDADFCGVNVRTATACGYSPRQRLDVVVNILTSHAYHTRRIVVHGGRQQRPNIHIDDVCDAYLALLGAPAAAVSGQAFNVSAYNHTVLELADLVRGVVGQECSIAVQPSNDLRSYRVTARKIAEAIGFAPTRTIEQAVRDLVAAFRAGLVPDAMTDARYYNVRRMTELGYGVSEAVA